jgi:hypothetical protein
MRSRLLPLILALAGACAFAFAVQTAWWSAGGVSIGPFGSRHCFSGECSEGGLAFLGGTDLWMRAGVAARAAGYITMFILIIVAGALAAKRVPTVFARSSLVATLTAAASGGYFLFAFPGASLGNEESVGAGVFLFVGAIVLAIAAAVLTLRLPTPDRR